MSQVARPVSDVTTGSWGTTPLWSKLNEVTPDDGTKVTSATNPTGDTFEVKLRNELTWPVAGAHTLSVRLKKTDSAALSVTAALMQGTKVIAYRQPTPATSFATVDLSLTDDEKARITDYTNLSVRLIAGNITVACCGVPLPPILNATFLAAGGCSCLDGLTIPLVYNPATGKWVGFVDDASCTTNALTVEWYCTGSGFAFVATGTPYGLPSPGPITSYTCSPFSSTFTWSTYGSYVACMDDLTVEISE